MFNADAQWTQKQADTYVAVASRYIENQLSHGNRNSAEGYGDAAVLRCMEYGYGWHGLYLMDYMNKLLWRTENA